MYTHDHYRDCSYNDSIRDDPRTEVPYSGLSPEKLSKQIAILKSAIYSACHSVSVKHMEVGVCYGKLSVIIQYSSI